MEFTTVNKKMVNEYHSWQKSDITPAYVTKATNQQIAVPVLCALHLP